MSMDPTNILRAGPFDPRPPPLGGPDLPRVDIVVVLHDSARWVAELVRAVAELDYPRAMLRLVAVDNASTDNGASLVEQAALARGIEFELIRNSRNLGFGKAANLGVRSGDAPWVLFLNPDTEIDSSCLRELAVVAATRPDAAIVEARQVPYEHPKLYDPVTLETPWSSAAACLARREAFVRAGGFDEALFLYGEDVDLCWRLRADGNRCYYAPRATVHHRCYEEAGVEKPLQSYYGTLHHLFLRWRYGSVGTILGGYLRLLCLLASLRRDRVRFRRFARVLFRHVILIPAALRGRRRLRRAGVATFRRWDYGQTRDVEPFRSRLPAGTPLVSIVVRTHRAAGFLREALASLANQTYPGIEAVVVEDGPGAGDVVAPEFAGRLSIRVLRAPEGSGRSRAGNLGVRESKGELVGFLDDDDVLFADHVECLVAAIERERTRAAYAVAFEARQRIASTEPLRYEIDGREIVWKQSFDRLRLLHHNYLPIQCVLFEKRLFEEVGGLDESLDCLEDWDLWLRFAIAGERFAFVPKVTSEYRRRLATEDERAIDAARQDTLDRAYPRVLDKYRSQELRLTVGDLHAAVAWLEDVARFHRRLTDLSAKGVLWAARRALRRNRP